MKIKQLLLTLVTFTLFLTSCSKEEIVGVDMENLNVSAPQTTTTLSTTSRTTSVDQNLRAYIFIEPVKKNLMIARYLKDSVASTPTRPFLGFGWGTGITSSNKNDLLNYMDLKYFYNGQLPAVITSDIPQTTGGVDSYGQPVRAYNFRTIRITKSQINDNAWVTVFIPVTAMNNDGVRQLRILSYGDGLKTTTINTNSTIHDYTLDYNGNRLPKGRYRVYTTFVSTSMRYSMVGNGFIYIKGNN